MCRTNVKSSRRTATRRPSTRNPYTGRRHRRYRLRVGRVIIVFLLLLATAYFLNGKTKIVGRKTEKTSKMAYINSLEVSTEKESTSGFDISTEFSSETFMNNTAQAEETFEPCVHINISQSEEAAMIEFYDSEISKDFKPYNSVRLNRTISEFEMYCMMRITYSEAGTQGIVGKTAVAATILNRMQDTSGLFENRIYDVIFQKEQFSSAMITDNSAPGRFYAGGIQQSYYELDEKVKSECMEAVKNAFDGEDPTKEITGGALYFFNPAQCSEGELALRVNIPYESFYIEEEHWFHREWPTA